MHIAKGDQDQQVAADGGLSPIAVIVEGPDHQAKGVGDQGLIVVLVEAPGHTARFTIPLIIDPRYRIHLPSHLSCQGPREI